MFKIITVIILGLSLSGCNGFKLRGNLTIPDYLNTISIIPNDQYDPFQRELRYRLTKHKVKILTTPIAKTTVLYVSKPEVSSQVLAYSSSDQVQRYRLIYTVNYKLSIHGTEPIQRSINRSREISQTNNLLLTNESEERLIQKELLGESVTELLRQITTRPRNKEPIADSSTNDHNPC